MCFLIAMEEEPGVRSARAVMAAKIPALYDMVDLELLLGCVIDMEVRRRSVR